MYLEFSVTKFQECVNVMEYQIPGFSVTEFWIFTFQRVKTTTSNSFFLINLFSCLIWNNLADNFIKSNIIYNAKFSVPPDQL